MRHSLRRPSGSGSVSESGSKCVMPVLSIPIPIPTPTPIKRSNRPTWTFQITRKGYFPIGAIHKQTSRLPSFCLVEQFPNFLRKFIYPKWLLNETIASLVQYFCGLTIYRIPTGKHNGYFWLNFTNPIECFTTVYSTTGFHRCYSWAFLF